MGQAQAKINVTKMQSYLRQSISRISIHRSKKLTAIAKKKDDIAKHLEAGNEVNAKIWAETLINDEGMVPCFDIVSILCDQLNGRLKTIDKFGPPKDMDQNFRTLVYAAPRMEIDELLKVRRELERLLGKEFIIAADTDEEAVNKVVAANINIRIPEEGEKIKRLIEIAKERNIDYKPSAEALQSLRDYCDRKGLENPLGGGGPKGVVEISPIAPLYNPTEATSMQYQPQNTQPQGFNLPCQTGMSGIPSIYQPPGPGYSYQMGQPPIMGAPMGAPVVPPQAPYNYYPPPQPSDYTLYDHNNAHPSEIDDFQAKLENLKKL